MLYVGGFEQNRLLASLAEYFWGWCVSRSPLSASIADKTSAYFLTSLSYLHVFIFLCPQQTVAAARLGRGCAKCIAWGGLSAFLDQSKCRLL